MPSGHRVPKWMGIAWRGARRGRRGRSWAAWAGSRWPGPKWGPHPPTGSNAMSQPPTATGMWARAGVPGEVGPALPGDDVAEGGCRMVSTGPAASVVSGGHGAHGDRAHPDLVIGCHLDEL